MCSQFSPTLSPIQVSMITQGMQPSDRVEGELRKVMRPMPAGSEMKVRTIGSMRLKKTAGAP